MFGYGSLMWRPGFDVARTGAGAADRAAPGALRLFFRPSRHAGAARAWFWASTAAACAAASPFASLPPSARKPSPICAAREQVTSVYLETMRRIELEDEARRQVRALSYIVDRGHVQYAGRLTLAESVHYVRQGHGRSGPNRDYVHRNGPRARGARLSRDRSASPRRPAAGTYEATRHRQSSWDSAPLPDSISRLPSATSRAVASSRTLSNRAGKSAGQVPARSARAPRPEWCREHGATTGAARTGRN